MIGLLLSACQREPELIGTEMDGREAANFTLIDQHGAPFQFSDLHGKAVALTFIFTNCPDVCPLIAQRLRTAYEALPDSTRDNVALVAVTVDPERDTPDALLTFSERHGLSENPQWFALTGERASLEEVWRNYYIDDGARTPPDHDHDHEHDGESDTSTDEADRMLYHTDAIYIIDPDGGMRILMRSDAQPEDIASNLRALAP